MIDYKLILILVLSIVLLYLYNKVETLKSDVSDLRRSQIEDNKVVQKILLTQDTMKLQNQNINSLNCVDGFCKMPSKQPNTLANNLKVTSQNIEQQVTNQNIEQQVNVVEQEQENLDSEIKWSFGVFFSYGLSNTPGIVLGFIIRFIVPMNQKTYLP